MPAGEGPDDVGGAVDADEHGAPDRRAASKPQKNIATRWLGCAAEGDSLAVMIAAIGDVDANRTAT